MPKFEMLSDSLSRQIEYETKTNTYARVGFDDSLVLRRDPSADEPTVWRPAFIQDIIKKGGLLASLKGGSDK